MPINYQKNAQNFNEQLLKIAEEAEKKIIGIKDSPFATRRKLSLAAIKHEVKKQIAQEVSKLFQGEDLNIQAIYDSSKEEFVLSLTSDSHTLYKELNDTVAHDDKITAEILKEFEGNKLLSSSKKQMTDIETELNNQLSLMNQQIDEAIDQYGKQDFKKYFVGATSICIATIMILIGLAAFTLCTAALGIAIASATAATNNALAGILLGTFFSGNVALGILSLPEVIVGAVVAGAASIGGLAGSLIYDHKQNNKNAFLEKHLQQESHNFINNFYKIGNDLLKISNHIINQNVNNPQLHADIKPDKVDQKNSPTLQKNNLKRSFVEKLSSKKNMDKNNPNLGIS